MAKTSIHIQPVKGGSEAHNRREKPLDYVRADLPHAYWQSQSQAEALSDIKERYRQSTTSAKHPNGQKMQPKATPIREGVVVVDASTTMADLHRLADALQARYGIRCFQCALHQDEGHWHGKDWVPNLHAHMVFDWTDKDGKSIKLNAQDMAQMQTMIADVLGMDRGQSSDKHHLSALQQKVSARRAELEVAEAELEDTTRIIEDAKTTLNVIKTDTDKAIRTRDRRKKEADKESGSRLKKATADLASSIANIAGAGKYAERKKEIDSLKAFIAGEPERTEKAVEAVRSELQPRLDEAEKQWGLWIKACEKAEAERDNFKDQAKKSSIFEKIIDFLINAAIDSIEILNQLINNGEATYTGEIHYGWFPKVGWADNATIRRDDNGNCKINGYSRLLDFIRAHPLENSQKESRGLHI